MEVPVRAALYSVFAAVVITLYSGKVCPLLEGLPVWKLAVLISLPLALCFGLRQWLEPLVVDGSAVRLRPLRQFRLDFGLFVIAGLASGIGGAVLFGFSFLYSGSKVVLGMLTVGVFAALDLALERERGLVRSAIRTYGLMHAPVHFSPLARRVAFVAMVVGVLATCILLLVTMGDLVWLADVAGEGASPVDMAYAVLKDIAVVMGVFLVLLLNLLFSYSRNVKLLFGNQTKALARVSEGDFDVWVPAMTNDEFGVIAVHTNRMIEALRGRMRLVEGMCSAREMQQAVLPDAPPSVPGLDMAAMGRFHGELGGGYYDFVRVGAGENARVGVVMGEVTGGGIGAALLMASVRAVARMRLEHAGALADVLREVNAFAAQNPHGTGRVRGLFMLLVREADRELTWAGTGHGAAFLYDAATDSFRELSGGGAPLGAARDAESREAEGARLDAGQVALVTGHGLWGAVNPHGEIFGKARLREAIRRNAHRNAAEMAQTILDAVEDFTHGAPHRGDLTLAVVRAAGAPAEEPAELPNEHPGA